MIRPSATGLATAFYRLYLLDSLASAPARPATLLATIAGERLPLANGAFGRALQSLLEGGYLVPAPEAAVTFGCSWLAFSPSFSSEYGYLLSVIFTGLVIQTGCFFICAGGGTSTTASPALNPVARA